MDQHKNSLNENGYLVLNEVLSGEQLKTYREICLDFLSGSIDFKHLRGDLGSAVDKTESQTSENISQIMWPSLYLIRDSNEMPSQNFCGQGSNSFARFDSLERSPLHSAAAELAKSLLGDDMEFDFDMIISKEPYRDVATPWHQDESYWLDLPDKRALSFWFPMQDAKIENGCMWFVPGSHLEGLRTHRPVKPGHHLMMTDEVDKDKGVACPVSYGGCTAHTGRTLHYTGGNTTSNPRIAYIVNFRPRKMIEYEREKNYDHGKTKGAITNHV